MIDWTTYFAKLAAEEGLTPREKAIQAGQFAGLGAVAIPSLAAAQRKIQHGSFLPAKGKGRGKFLAASVLGGLFWGGGLPAVQHLIAQRNLKKSKGRKQTQAELGQLAVESGMVRRPQPTQMPAPQMQAPTVPKLAASSKISDFLKARKDRRPIRVSRLLEKEREGTRGPSKIASDAGQDLRLPVMGGTKFPTGDSKGEAESLLSKSQSSTEVGPTPSTAKLQPTGPEVKDIAVPGGSPNIMPKVGMDMSLQNDPLIQYLKKQAMALDTNEKDMKTGKEEKEVASEDPTPAEIPKKTLDKGKWGSYFSQHFSNSGSARPQFEEKDKPAKVGEVDKVLRKK